MKTNSIPLFAALPYTVRWWKNEGVLGTKFSTQAELKTRIREVVNRAEINKPLQEADAAFLTDVLRRHQRWEAKQGPGVKAIVVRMNPPPGFGHATRGLWLIRTDSVEMDISWYAPLERGGALYAARGVALAARCEVSDQTRAVFDRFRGTPCPVCGRPLMTGHVDHVPPLTFIQLFSNWLTVEAIADTDIELSDIGTTSLFADRLQAARWSDFHQANATLRLIHPEENLAQAK